jgi:hypothetical protein
VPPSKEDGGSTLLQGSCPRSGLMRWNNLIEIIFINK